MAILLAELNGGTELFLGEKPGTVKVVKTIIRVEPAAYVAIVLSCVAYDLVELVARMAVLCLCIADGYSLRWLSHRPDVEGKAVRMALAKGPYFVGNNR